MGRDGREEGRRGEVAGREREGKRGREMAGRSELEGIEYERKAAQGTHQPWQHLPNHLMGQTHLLIQIAWAHEKMVKKSKKQACTTSRTLRLFYISLLFYKDHI